ncbi:hypothetical protein [Lentzea fradiae]|uniref:hypothetical protein n=1 Tax=Lentzea fradiae TaxID=200378 RepID=UPI001C409F75|nr:hypothetical protein [Lentzea fradiae]
MLDLSEGQERVLAREPGRRFTDANALGDGPMNWLTALGLVGSPACLRAASAEIVVGPAHPSPEGNTMTNHPRPATTGGGP